MKSIRLNLRLPQGLHSVLKAQADSAGYTSPAQLVRCILTQYVRHADRLRLEREQTAWMDEFCNEHSDRDREDPTQRKRINERL